MRRCGERIPTKDFVYLCRLHEGHPEDHRICGDREHRHGSTPCTVFGTILGEDDGAMAEAVRADLRAVDVKSIPGGRTYQAMAFWLAGVIDSRGSDDGPSTTAKLADQLSKVLAQLMKGGSGGDRDSFDDWQDQASTPIAG